MNLDLSDDLINLVVAFADLSVVNTGVVSVHLKLFKSSQVFSNLSAVFSGLVRYDRYSIQQVPEVVGESGHMLIHFYSDVAYNMTGFNITFR